MPTIRARTVALAAFVAGGMLCEALICEPAQAGTSCTPQPGTLAFQCTQTNTMPDLYVVLELFDGSAEMTVYSNDFTGWVSNISTVPPGIGVRAAPIIATPSATLAPGFWPIISAST
jgi:hypothetical protein